LTCLFWRDWLNPLCLVIFLGFVRFGIPGLQVFFQDANHPLYKIMDLSKDDLLLGHNLALIGLLSVVIGWYCCPSKIKNAASRLINFIPNDLSRHGFFAAVMGGIIGLLALLLFVDRNAAIEEVLYTGGFRSTTIQLGTGPYFRLSFILISSTVILSSYLNKSFVWWISLMPSLFAMTAYGILGGRIRALTPIAASLLVLWEGKHQAKHCFIKFLSFTFIIIITIIFLCFGQLYRGGYGIEALGAFSIQTLVDYIRYSIWVDLGQLHSLAGAVAIGPGLLEGKTFISCILWPLSAIFHLGGRSPGIFIAETLYGVGAKKWGFHSTMIGDAYLNFGLIGVVFISIIFGIFIKIFYEEMRKRSLNIAFYSLAMIYSIRIFFESIEKYPETLVVLICASLILKAGKLLDLSSFATKDGLRLGKMNYLKDNFKMIKR
jgi:oligosaccharide repeat unit polymerase